MSVKTLICITCLLALSFGTAQSNEMSTLFLPAHIESNDGAISMHADYGSVDTSGRIPVYFINRTNHPITLNAQDGDIYLKLEYEEDGQWIRAQPHYYSWCGNSYMYNPTIRPGHYIVVGGYQPINGEAKKVRYRLHSQEIELVTNVGEGVVAADDIERASRDGMAIKEGDFDLVSKIVLRLTERSNDQFVEYERHRAISELASGRFDSDKSTSVLMELKNARPDLLKTIEHAVERLERVTLEDQ